MLRSGRSECHLEPGLEPGASSWISCPRLRLPACCGHPCAGPGHAGGSGRSRTCSWSIVFMADLNLAVLWKNGRWMFSFPVAFLIHKHLLCRRQLSAPFSCWLMPCLLLSQEDSEGRGISAYFQEQRYPVLDGGVRSPTVCFLIVSLALWLQGIKFRKYFNS